VRGVVDDVAPDPPDRVAGDPPQALLAVVLLAELMVLPPVHFNDQPSLEPDQIGFLAGNPDVDGRAPGPGVVKQLEGPPLSIRAGSL
jgi:hypothetical protein